MYIARLDGSGLRNLQPFSLQPALLNVLAGDNGSGKSSTLEALHLLATGRSFRGSKVDGAIAHGQAGATFFALGREPGGREHRYGYHKPRGEEPEIRIDGEAAGLGDIAAALPVRFIGPGSEELLEGEPAIRRGFLDWILFHVEQSYLGLWRRANRALAQRNALLKQRAAPAALKPWTRELAEASLRIAELRQSALTDLQAELQPLLPRFAFIEAITLQYARTGQPESDADWLELEARERELGYSLFGFQRDDLRIRVAEGMAREILSRGQRKVLVYALLLAEAALVRRKTGKISVLLLDDLCSELDRNNAAEVLRLVLDTGMQAFITVLDPHELDGLLPATTDRKMFHVEQGLIRPWSQEP
ncbi:MAG: DNA replication/repair protein RecF [Pseudomonadota bacterium]